MAIPLLIAGGLAAAGTAAAAGIGAASNAANMTEEERVRQAALARLAAIQDPTYSSQQYQTETYNPELYASPEDAAYQEVEIDPRIREYQLAALSQLADRYNGAADAQMNAEQYQARNQASRLAQGREGAIVQNMQARGMGGAGMEAVLRAQAAQEGANRAQAGGLQAAQNMALQKLAGQASYLQGMGSFRGQEQQMAGQNADIINRFNMHNTGMRNQTNQANVDMKNKGSLYNIGAKAGDRAANIDRGDKNTNARFQAQVQKAGGATAIDQRGADRMAAGNDRNAALAGAAIQAGTNIAGQGIAAGMAGGGGGQVPGVVTPSARAEAPIDPLEWQRRMRR